MIRRTEEMDCFLLDHDAEEGRSKQHHKLKNGAEDN